MKQNNKIKLALLPASLCGVGSLYAATSQDVQFSGSMVNSCTVTSTADGTLGFNGNNTLSTELTGGGRGQVTINCLGSGTVSLSLISAVSANATTAGFNSTWGSELLEAGIVKAYRNNTGTNNLSNQAFNGTAKNYTLKVWVDHTPNFSVGTYTYKVTTTVTAL